METRLITIIVGYWKSNSEPYFPVPKPNRWKGQTNKENFMDWLWKFIKKHLKQDLAYRGWSNCRICGAKNGSHEYKIRFKAKSSDEDEQYIVTMFIPSGFFHYINEHDVKPNLKFFKALKNKEPITPFLTNLLPGKKNTYFIG